MVKLDYFSPPGRPLARPSRSIIMFCCCYVFISFVDHPLPLDSNYLRMYWTDLHQIFRVGRYMGVDDQSAICFKLLKGHCRGNQFWGRFNENWHTPALFFVLPFHNGWEDRNTNGCVNTIDDPSTWDKEVCERRSSNPGVYCKSWVVVLNFYAQSMLTPCEVARNAGRALRLFLVFIDILSCSW